MAAPHLPQGTSDSDYDVIESAVMETARGRWFLAEYARRNRRADTDALLAAIARLERMIVAPGLAVQQGEEMSSLTIVAGTPSLAENTAPAFSSQSHSAPPLPRLADSRLAAFREIDAMSEDDRLLLFV